MCIYSLWLQIAILHQDCDQMIKKKTSYFIFIIELSCGKLSQFNNLQLRGINNYYYIILKSRNEQTGKVLSYHQFKFTKINFSTEAQNNNHNHPFNCIHIPTFIQTQAIKHSLQLHCIYISITILIKYFESFKQ
jgi:hypothetical protein